MCAASEAGVGGLHLHRHQQAWMSNCMWACKAAIACGIRGGMRVQQLHTGQALQHAGQVGQARASG
jgi:hypothetical protein